MTDHNVLFEAYTDSLYDAGHREIQGVWDGLDALSEQSDYEHFKPLGSGFWVISKTTVGTTVLPSELRIGDTIICGEAALCQIAEWGRWDPELASLYTEATGGYDLMWGNAAKDGLTIAQGEEWALLIYGDGSVVLSTPEQDCLLPCVPPAEKVAGWVREGEFTYDAFEPSEIHHLANNGLISEDMATDALDGDWGALMECAELMKGVLREMFADA
jgi:hypothetical protein